MTQETPKIEPSDPIGLCALCRHVRAVAAPRAVYMLCERAATDSAYDKYPRLPVRQCPGYERREPGNPKPRA